ncbi:bifunctional biotin--[acetyl-CoA-carboxylase] ligase/biotin operon repressor BirA [Pokkaliibacter sp. CJK22405]|uniref:bifunctional biotin--[acetyl-CoA-carboxylase] ligase/biotin operon repressor BirA n=1 Tax=Pokkaliibacter sp. CJK22405 TaxID=3384615 RepID=UPI003984905F
MKELNTSGRALLMALADGQWHTGDELGEMLGVSRAAVWKQLKKLQAMQLEIFAVKGRGYRLSRPLELIDPQALRQRLQDESATCFMQVHYSHSLDSTNLTAMNMVAEGKTHGQLVVAEHQAAGRGRRGKSWHSPFGENIYLSLIWSFQGGLAGLEGLSLAIGLGLAKGLHRLGVEGVELKWPNDVLIDNKKVSGILIEVSGETEGECHVVIGIGLNVEMQNATDDLITQPWCSLRPYLPADVGRNALLQTVMVDLVGVLEQFVDVGFAGLRDEWLTYSAHMGQALRLSSGTMITEGVMVGLTDTGGLEVRTAKGVEVFYGGEVSVRAVSAS